MARKVKCPICNKLNDKEDTILISQKYYCQECAEIKQEELDRNKDNWDELFQYICELYNIKTLTGMMFKQIRDYRTINNYTNKGILLTLKYYYETLENEVKENTGLGIVTYYYEEAKRHFIEKLNVKKYMDSFELQEEIKTVLIKTSDIENKNSNKQLPLEVSWEQGEHE